MISQGLGEAAPFGGAASLLGGLAFVGRVPKMDGPLRCSTPAAASVSHVQNNGKNDPTGLVRAGQRSAHLNTGNHWGSNAESAQAGDQFKLSGIGGVGGLAGENSLCSLPPYTWDSEIPCFRAAVKPGSCEALRPYPAGR